MNRKLIAIFALMISMQKQKETNMKQINIKINSQNRIRISIQKITQPPTVSYTVSQAIQ